MRLQAEAPQPTKQQKQLVRKPLTSDPVEALDLERPEPGLRISSQPPPLNPLLGLTGSEVIRRPNTFAIEGKITQEVFSHQHYFASNYNFHQERRGEASE